jgi:hypothetical protein
MAPRGSNTQRTGVSTRSQRRNRQSSISPHQSPRSDSESTAIEDSMPPSSPRRPAARRNPPPHRTLADDPNALLIAAQIKSLAEEDARKAEAHRLQMERQAEVHAATMARLNTAPAGQGEPEAPEGRSIELPPAARDLALQIPGLHEKDLLAIWKGSFDPDNTARLRSHARHRHRGNVTTLEDGRLETGPPKADLKPLHSPEIYFECFTNYIIIVSSLCQCPPGLQIAMLHFINKIRSLSGFYTWKGAVLDLALAYHRVVMNHGQLEPTNWTIPDSFQYTFTTPFMMLEKGLAVRGAAGKRSRTDTRTSPPLVSNTCNSFNKGTPCLKDPCKFEHRCSKCGSQHPASSRKCAL